MPEQVRVAEYIPPQETKSGKWTPHKFRDGNSRVFVFGKQDVDLIKSREGKDLEITYDAKNKYDEYPLTSAKAPEPKPQPQGSGWGKSPEESARICRQNALTNTISFFFLPPIEQERFLKVLQGFAAWNFEGTIPVAEQKAQPTGRLTTHLREGESLQDAARRAVAEHDAAPIVRRVGGIPDEDELAPIPEAPPPADWDGPSNRTPTPRETVGPRRTRG